MEDNIGLLPIARWQNLEKLTEKGSIWDNKNQSGFLPLMILKMRIDTDFTFALAVQLC